MKDDARLYKTAVHHGITLDPHFSIMKQFVSSVVPWFTAVSGYIMELP